MSNPLEAYRRAQRELRRHFDAFTRENCPACPTPCCARPARIAPTDILLAEAAGWKSGIIPLEPKEQAAGEQADSVAEAAGRMLNSLSGVDAGDGTVSRENWQPCEYLGEQGCTFPNDLRPFGCTTYLCKYMYARLDRRELSRIKRLARELEARHTELLRAIRPVAWREEEA